MEERSDGQMNVTAKTYACMLGIEVEQFRNKCWISYSARIEKPSIWTSF